MFIFHPDFTTPSPSAGPGRDCGVLWRFFTEDLATVCFLNLKKSAILSAAKPLSPLDFAIHADSISPILTRRQGVPDANGRFCGGGFRIT